MHGTRMPELAVPVRSVSDLHSPCSPFSCLDTNDDFMENLWREVPDYFWLSKAPPLLRLLYVVGASIALAGRLNDPPGKRRFGGFSRDNMPRGPGDAAPAAVIEAIGADSRNTVVIVKWRDTLEYVNLVSYSVTVYDFAPYNPLSSSFATCLQLVQASFAAQKARGSGVDERRPAAAGARSTSSSSSTRITPAPALLEDRDNDARDRSATAMSTASASASGTERLNLADPGSGPIKTAKELFELAQKLWNEVRHYKRNAIGIAISRVAL